MFYLFLSFAYLLIFLNFQVNYRGYLLGDRIIGDIFTSTYSMGNMTSEIPPTPSGKFQLQRYSDEEINKRKKSLEVKENLKFWSEMK